MREIKLPLDIESIRECIPHRYPFLMVDRVIEFEHDQRIVATKCISNSEPSLMGHFPEVSLFPGVLIVEGMAQSAGILGFLTSPGKKIVRLTEITQSRFRLPVVPGDVLLYRLTRTNRRGNFHWFSGIAEVDKQVVANIAFSALMKDDD
jgi:3-hydroxyacyl-[acyl-carrier-protein] dehydratase